MVPSAELTTKQTGTGIWGKKGKNWDYVIDYGPNESSTTSTIDLSDSKRETRSSRATSALQLVSDHSHLLNNINSSQRIDVNKDFRVNHGMYLNNLTSGSASRRIDPERRNSFSSTSSLSSLDEEIFQEDFAPSLRDSRKRITLKLTISNGASEPKFSSKSSSKARKLDSDSPVQRGKKLAEIQTLPKRKLDARSSLESARNFSTSKSCRGRSNVTYKKVSHTIGKVGGRYNLRANQMALNTVGSVYGKSKLRNCASRKKDSIGTKIPVRQSIVLDL